MPLSSGIMVFEVRGGQILMYFRNRFGISLGMHFCDHVDLILSSFWVIFWSRRGPGSVFSTSTNCIKNVWILDPKKGTNKNMPEVGGRWVAAGGGTPMKLHPTASAPASASEIRSRRGCGMRACLTQTLPSGMRARPDLLRLRRNPAAPVMDIPWGRGSATGRYPMGEDVP